MTTVTYSAANGSGDATVNNGIVLLDSGTHLVTDPFASFQFITDSESIDVTYYNDYFDSFPSLTKIGIYVDGTYHSSLTPTAEGSTTGTVSLSSGTKLVSFVNGPQSGVGVSSSIGTFVTGIDFKAGSATEVTGLGGPRWMFYGDSIAVGDGSTVPMRDAWMMQIREHHNPLYSACDARGSRTLWDDTKTAPLQATFVSNAVSRNPKIIWFAIGTNDYGLNRLSAADFGTNYASLLDDLNTALPSAIIYCQTPIVRTNESANSFGDTLGKYREQIYAAVAARSSFARFVDGESILTTSELGDGLHPNQDGHDLIYQTVSSRLALSTAATGMTSSLTLQYEFAANKSLAANSGRGPTLGITNSTGGTYRDVSTTMQTASANTARFQHNVSGTSLGLLVEPGTTNRAFPSEDFADGVEWAAIGAGASVTANAAVSPDGLTTADKLVEGTNTGGHAIQNTISGLTASSQYCFSCFAKAAERDWFALYFGNVGKGKYFDLTNGAVGSDLGSAVDDSGIEPWGNGWYRCWIVFTESNTSEATQIYTATGDSTFSYTGDGSSGVYIWGSDFEPGAKPTSYYPAPTAAATRSKDDIETTDLSWRGSSNSMYVKFNSGELSGDRTILSLHDTTADERIAVEIQSSTLHVIGVDGGVTQFDITNAVSANTDYELAFAVAANDVEAYLNGTSIGSDTGATLPTVTTLTVGGDHANAEQPNTTIDAIRNYDSRLTSVQLENMSNGVFPDSGGLKLVYDITRDVTRNITRDISG